MQSKLDRSAKFLIAFGAIEIVWLLGVFMVGFTLGRAAQ